MRSHLRKVFVGFFLISLPLSASAAGEMSGATSGRTAMLQTAIGLTIVIAVIYALAWLAKRTSIGGLGRDKDLKVVEILPLGSREKAVLVDVAGTQMLLGVAPGRVSTLHVFPDAVVDTHSEKNTKPFSLSASTSSEFSKKLKVFLSQGHKP